MGTAGLLGGTGRRVTRHGIGRGRETQTRRPGLAHPVVAQTPWARNARASIHETMEARHEVGAIDDQTMREFDDSCLTPVEPLSPAAIRALREREHLSQPVFTRYLNLGKNLVSDWGRGVKRPGGPALRFLTVIEKKGIQAIA